MLMAASATANAFVSPGDHLTLVDIDTQALRQSCPAASLTLEHVEDGVDHLVAPGLVGEIRTGTGEKHITGS